MNRNEVIVDVRVVVVARLGPCLTALEPILLGYAETGYWVPTEVIPEEDGQDSLRLQLGVGGGKVGEKVLGSQILRDPVPCRRPVGNSVLLQPLAIQAKTAP